MRHWLALLLVVALAAVAAPRSRDRFWDRFWGRATFIQAAALSTVPYDGGWVEFLRADGYGSPTAPCTCETLHGVSPDGDAGLTLTFTRTSTAWCNKKGMSTTGLANGDLVSCATGTARAEPDDSDSVQLSCQLSRVPHTAQPGSRPSVTLRHSIARPSSSNRRPSRVVPHPTSNFSASAAWVAPMMPVSGAKTPMTAQRISSTSSPSGNRQ